MSRRARVLLILGIYLGLFIMLGTIPMPVAAQAEPRDLKWTTIDRPGAYGNVVVAGSDVSEIAIGGSLFYVLDTTNSRIYRSMNGGLRWEDISSYLSGAGAGLPATKIAIAPDQPAIVAVATDGGTGLYLSVDGGITWGNMHLSTAAGTTVQSIAISKSYGELNEQRDILVGTARYGNNLSTGQVLLLHLGSIVPAWKDLKVSISGSTGADISAVAFSPSYTDDETIVAIASTGIDVDPPQGKTYLCVGINVDVVAGSVTWKPSIEIFAAPYTQSVGDYGSMEAFRIGGGLAMPSNFSATSASGKSPLVYAFYTADPDGTAPSPDPSNVYQIDTWVPTVTAFTGVGNKRYSSIALSGSKLLAGEASGPAGLTIPVRISLNANTTTPAFTNSGYPYGQGNAKVAWSSNVAYCGTSGSESGFSISNDNGAHWSQVGLIDTTVQLQDVAVASSPQSIFVTSTSTSGVESVWRSAGEPLGQYWGRVLATDGLSSKLAVRLSPKYRDDYTVYVSEVTTEKPIITTFIANPSTVFSGNSTTLQWNVTSKTPVSVSIDQGIGPVAASGSQPTPVLTAPPSTYTYTITATNSYGSVTASVTVTVVTTPGLPQINGFFAIPSSIIAGQSSTLQWNVSGATSISIDRDIGTVAAAGSQIVSPSLTTGYTLTATNGVGSITAYTTITVSPQFWVSNDRGNAWKQYYPLPGITTITPPGIIDLAVADKKVCYIALEGGRVSKSDSGGQFWKSAVSTELPEISMLSLADADTVLVGGKHGDVAYSTDGGKSYSRIPEALRNDAPVQVAADARYQQNTFIYAGCDNVIYRWALGKGDHWDAIRTTATNRRVSGMVSVGGILYSAWYNPEPTPLGAPPSGAERTLDPAVPLTSLEWDSIQAGATAARFNNTPSSLRYSTTDRCVILWAIDTSPMGVSGNPNPVVMVYFDCLAWKGPTVTLGNNAVIGCDPATGRNQEVNFTWEDICADNRYQLQIAKDSDFAMRVFDSGDAYPFLLPAVQTSPALVYFASGDGTSPLLAGIQVPALECGHSYYWRVRARAAVTGDIIRSPWSEIRAFTMKAGFRVTTPYYGPQLLAPDNGCGCPCGSPAAFSWTPFKETTAYRFELATNANMSSPLVSTTVTTTAYQYQGQLKCGATYFWRVMALQPAPSEWSAVFSFKVRPAVQEAPTAASTPTAVPAAQPPLWAWLVMLLSGALLVGMAVLMVLLKERYR